MNQRLFSFFVLMLIIISSCSKDEEVDISELLTNDKGWYTYEHRQVIMGVDTGFTEDEPYIIFGEYGSGLRFIDAGVCYINYSDGTVPIIEAPLNNKYWSVLSGNQIEFKFSPEDTSGFTITIVEISQDFLWFKRVQDSNNLEEYKLKRIE